MPQLQREPTRGAASEWARRLAQTEGLVDHDAHTVRLPRRASDYARSEGVQEGTISARLTQLADAGVLRSRKPIEFDLSILDGADAATIIAFPAPPGDAALTGDQLIIQLIAQQIARDPTAPQVAALAARLHDLARETAENRAGSAENPRAIAENPRTARPISLDQTDLEVSPSVEKHNNQTTSRSVSSLPRENPRAKKPRNRAEPVAEIAEIAEIAEMLRDAYTDWDTQDLDRWLQRIGQVSSAQGLPERPRPLLPLVTAMSNWGRLGCDHAIERFATQLAEPTAHGIRNPWAVLVDIFTNGNDGYFPPGVAPTPTEAPRRPTPEPAAVDYETLIDPDPTTIHQEAASRQIAEWEADPGRYHAELARIDALLDDLKHHSPAVVGAIRHLSPRHQRAIVLARELGSRAAPTSTLSGAAPR